MASPDQETDAFTLAELLVAIGGLSLLVLLLTQLMNHTAAVATLGQKRIDADSQARPIFERMALDFAHLIKRNDISYYLKTASTPMPGNDLIGFYSAVQGYHPTIPSPVSVVAYRVNSDPANSLAYNSLERMGKGLDWNGVSPISAPVVFLPLTLSGTWPSVASSSAYDEADPSKRTYEIIGAQVFRFEYYYVEKTTGNVVSYPITWTSLSEVALRDASAIAVAIAVIDPKSRALLSNAQVGILSQSLPDYSSGWRAGELLAQWRSALSQITTLPPSAITGIRLYERCFPISE